MYAYVCVLGQSQCCESTPFPPTLPIAAVRSLEGKVDDLQSGQDSLRTDVQGLQMGQDSLSQRMQEVETQSQGV